MIIEIGRKDLETMLNMKLKSAKARIVKAKDLVEIEAIILEVDTVRRTPELGIP